MIRMCLVLTTALVISANASAGMLQFLPGTVPPGENPLTVLGDGRFELSDTPNPAPNDFQFPALIPFDVEVVADTGPVVFSLVRGSTTDGKVNLIFRNSAVSDSLLLSFDNAMVSRGDPITAPLSDDDGVVIWNAPGLGSPSTAPKLAGSLLDAMLIPEPTGCGGLIVLLLGFGAYLRHRA